MTATAQRQKEPLMQPQTALASDPGGISPTAGDRERLLGLINAGWTTQVIATAVALGLIDAIGAGPANTHVLAEAVRAHAPSVARLLRAMTSLDLCAQNADGDFCLTPAGSLLCADADDSLSAWAELSGGRIWAQWGRLGESVRTGHSIRKLTLADDDFSHLDEDAKAAELFNRAMVELTLSVARDVAQRVDFCAARRVVDVGGGYGQLLCSILAANPLLQGVLFDMAHATGQLASPFESAGVANRCELTTGDFFKTVPHGADVYLLKSILHDWDDERCMVILRNCRRAMLPAARLLIIERIASDRVTASPHDQAVARSDLNMMVANGGCERTQAAYLELLEAADLRLSQVTPLSGPYSVIAAAPR
jgi:orsellinic acid C2-O-methyltransferase